MAVLLGGLLSGFLGLAMFHSPAKAADYALRIQVKEQSRDANGKADNQPVVGVTVTVTDADGNEVGTGETDEEGVALIPVPDRGDYTVSVKRGRGATRRPYERGDFDVLVAYLPDRDALTFWTFDDIRGRQNVRYNPARHRQPGNWEILSQVAESLTSTQ